MSVRKKNLFKNSLSINDYFIHDNNLSQVIDLRSESEFNLDHIPGAKNYPVLDDEQRKLVGTLYKTNPFEAKKIGASIICKNISHFLESSWKNNSKDWNPILYCWRGGLRSKSTCHILEKIGWKARIIDGGYKSYRKYVIEKTAAITNEMSFIVVCGLTGSGKTKFLNEISASKQILDLEDLASHRGSLLGDIPDKQQPSQKMFESMLLEQLKKFDKDKKIYVESESKKIGNVQIPDSLIDVIRKSECIWLELPDEERIKLLKKEYEHLVIDKKKLNLLTLKIKKIKNQEIYNAKRLSKNENIDEIIGELLHEHYDPAYKSSMKKNFKMIAMAKRIYISKFSSYSSEVEEEIKRLG